MLYFIAIVNFWGVFTLWRHFKLLKGAYYDQAAQLELARRQVYKSECEAALWRQHYERIYHESEVMSRGTKAYRRQGS